MRDLVDALTDTSANGPALEQPYDSPVAETEPIPKFVEFVVDQAGNIRQAGADTSNTPYLAAFKQRAEQSLYVFAKGVLGLDRLTNDLHKDVCKFLQKIPPYRKLTLLPRDHLKTSIVSRSLPMHMLIQPKDANVYMPGKLGRDMRILLAGEALDHAANQLGWMKGKFEGNQLLRALWPTCSWANPRTQARMWNNKAIVLPREQDYPEGSIEVFGVGGAVTGRHYDVIIKDDLISLEAANSAAVMLTAIQWHVASRALLDDVDRGLEFIIGTRWAVHDLYDDILTNDPSVESYIRAIVENGKTICPQWGNGEPAFSLETVDRLRKEKGVLFPLLYMNSAADPTLVDFDIEQLREFRIVGDSVEFEEDERDYMLQQRADERGPARMQGAKLTPEVKSQLFGRRDQFIRARY